MMKKRYVRKSILIGFGCMLLFVSGVANTAYADDDPSLAKTKFKEGVSLFSSDDYSGALDAFGESYRLSPKTGTLFNIAMCYKALHRNVDAAEAFRRFLDEVVRSENPEKVEKAETALLELNAMMGQLILVDAPIGASLTINNSPFGKVPLEVPIILDPGRYQIQVSKAGFETLSTSVTLASGAIVRLRAALQQEPTKSRRPTMASDILPTVRPKVPITNEDSTEKSSTLFVLSLVSGGLGIAAFSAGAYFNYQREVADINDARAAADRADYDKIIERGKEHERALAICYSIGGFFLATGLILYIVHQTTDSTDFALNHDGIALRF